MLFKRYNVYGKEENEYGGEYFIFLFLPNLFNFSPLFSYLILLALLYILGILFSFKKTAQKKNKKWENFLIDLKIPF